MRCVNSSISWVNIRAQWSFKAYYIYNNKWIKQARTNARLQLCRSQFILTPTQNNQVQNKELAEIIFLCYFPTNRFYRGHMCWGEFVSLSSWDLSLNYKCAIFQCFVPEANWEWSNLFASALKVKFYTSLGYDLYFFNTEDCLFGSGGHRFFAPCTRINSARQDTHDIQKNL